MTNLLLITFLGMLIVSVFNIGRLLFPWSRQRAKFWLKRSGAMAIATFIGSAFLVASEQGEEARSKGFANSQEMRDAKAANISDPIVWQSQKAFIEQQAAKNQEAIEAEKERITLAAEAEKERIREAAKIEKQRIIREVEAQKAAEEARLREVVLTQEKFCKRDLQCLSEKHFVTASVDCRDPIERLSKYTYEWTDGWFEQKFSHFHWKDKSSGIITYIGDKIKFQNGFGAWQNSIYECDFDTNAQKPIAVRAGVERL